VKKTHLLVKIKSPQARSRRFQLQKCSQLFIRTHNETLSAAAMRVSNPDRSPLRIKGLTRSPQLQPALLRLSAMISQDFSAGLL